MKNFPTTNTNTSGIPERKLDVDILNFDYNQYHNPNGKNLFDRVKPWDEML